MKESKTNRYNEKVYLRVFKENMEKKTDREQ